MIRLIFAVVVAVIVAIFAGQNSERVHIQFLWWRVPGVSEVIVILLSVLLGVVLAVLVRWWTRRSRPEPRPLMERASDSALTANPGHEGANASGAGAETASDPAVTGKPPTDPDGGLA